MTPEELASLHDFGEDLVVYIIVFLVIMLILYGVYFVLSFAAVYALLKRRQPHTMATYALLSIMILAWMCMTAYVAVDISFILARVRATLMWNPGESDFTTRLSQGIQAASRFQDSMTWIAGTDGLVFLIGDATVVWRTWAVWPERRSIVLIPLVFLFATFGVSVATDFMLQQKTHIITTSSPLGIMIVSGTVLSLATNLSSTILIGVKAYMHRELMKSTMGVSKSKGVRVLLILTESGVFYCAVQFIACVLDALDNTNNSVEDVAFRISSMLLTYLSVMYPPVTVLIILSHHSIARILGNQTLTEDEFSSQYYSHGASPQYSQDTDNKRAGKRLGNRTLGTHISFAPSPQGTGTLNSSHRYSTGYGPWVGSQTGDKEDMGKKDTMTESLGDSTGAVEMQKFGA